MNYGDDNNITPSCINFMLMAINDLKKLHQLNFTAFSWTFLICLKTTL